MVDQISAIQKATPITADSVNEASSSQRVATTNKTDKGTSAQHTTKTSEAYKVTLSKLAQVHALKQTGASVSIIAAKLGLTKTEVDQTLSISTTQDQTANAETVAALL